MKKLILVLIASAGIASAQSPKQKLNGEWTGTLVLDNSSPHLTLVFQLTDSTFAGKIYADGSLYGDMQEGSLNGDKFSFKIPGGLAMSGTVAVPTMKVDMVMYNGSVRALTLRKTPETTRDSTPAKRPPNQIDSAIAFSSSVMSVGTSAKRPVLR